MRIFIALIVLVIVRLTGTAQNPSWGDQCNGTYKNPVLYANYPDIDIEKQGDIWYMISSTNSMVPGMTILESKDLVNWQLVTNIVDKIWWRPEFNPDSLDGIGGVWAGDLAYFNNMWHCYFIDKWKGLFVYTAPAITGPWSNGKLMKEKTDWTDPSVFVDPTNNQKYLICHFNTVKEKNALMYESRLFNLSNDGMELADTGKILYTGQMSEAAKLYKINGYYYIFMAEWVNDPNLGRDRKQFVLRSANLFGPYEKNTYWRNALKKTAAPVRAHWSKLPMENGGTCTRCCKTRSRTKFAPNALSLLSGKTIGPFWAMIPVETV